MPFEETEYAVIDFETTGGPPDENRIMEIGVVFARGRTRLGSFERIVRPGGPVHPYVWKLTGLDRRAVESAEPLDFDLDEFIARIGTIPKFAHDAKFDSGVLNRELARRNRPPIGGWHCTVHWAKAILPGLRAYRLSTLSEDLGLGLTNAHRGLADAEATFNLVVRLADRAAEKGHDLLALATEAESGALSKEEIAKIFGQG